MNSSSSNRDPHLSPTQRAFLLDWEGEWRTHLALRAVTPPEMPAASQEAETLEIPYADPFHKELAVGDIRLPSPDLTPEAEVPPYVAVVGRWRRDWVVVPFSPFASPAFPGELLLPTPFCPPLGVLQVWNARTLDSANLCRSWHLDTLPLEACRDAYDLFGYFFAAQPFPEHLRDRVGAPMHSLLDSRHRYQQEQRRLYVELRPGSKYALPEPGQIIHLFASGQTRMAAAGGDMKTPLRALSGPFAEQVIYLQPDSPFVLHVGQTLVPETVWILPGNLGEELAATLRGAEVFLVRTSTGHTLARGHVDGSASIVRMEELIESPVVEAVLEQHDLGLVLR